MKNTKFTKAMMATVLGSVLVSGAAFAQNVNTTTDRVNQTTDRVNTTTDRVQNEADRANTRVNEANAKANSSMDSVGTYMDDSAITAKVKAAHLSADNLKSGDITVETNQGVVRLTGSVENQAEKERAESVARSVEGVKDVKNDLTIKP